MYSFYYVESNGTKVTFDKLTKRKAIMLYNKYLRDAVLNDYKTVGWKKED